MLALVFEITAKFQTCIPVDDRTRFLQIVTQSHNFNSLSFVHQWVTPYNLLYFSFWSDLRIHVICLWPRFCSVEVGGAQLFMSARVFISRIQVMKPSCFSFIFPLYISLSILESQAFWSYICVWLLLSGIALSKVFISSDTSDYRALLLLQNPMAS